jgi:hypothetical protein
MPMISNIFAIQRALGKKIRDSLDVFHSGINDVMIKIIRLENYGLSVFEITLGLTLFSMGLLTYYGVPAAFLYNRLEIFFFILNLILIGMIIGLTFLCFLIFPYIQTGIIYLITWTLRFDLKLRPLILKNLNYSHQKRNMKTSMLFTIALAYLVFGGSSILLIGNLIIGFVKSFVGSDVLVSSSFSTNHLPEGDLRTFLDSDISSDSPRTAAYAFRGIEIAKYFEDVFEITSEVYLSSGGDYPENDVSLYPVESTYLQAALIEYYIPKYTQGDVNFNKSQGKVDLVQSLYSDEGTEDYGTYIDFYDIASKNLTYSDSDNVSNFTYVKTKQIKAILPEGIRSVLSVDGGDTIKLTSNQNWLKGPDIYRFLVRGMPQKMPGFFFMSYKQVMFFLQGLISFPDAFALAYFQSFKSPYNRNKYLAYIAQDDIKTYTYFYPKERLLVRLEPGISDEDRNILV